MRQQEAFPVLRSQRIEPWIVEQSRRGSGARSGTKPPMSAAMKAKLDAKLEEAKSSRPRLAEMHKSLGERPFQTGNAEPTPMSAAMKARLLPDPDGDWGQDLPERTRIRLANGSGSRPPEIGGLDPRPFDPGLVSVTTGLHTPPAPGC